MTGSEVTHYHKILIKPPFLQFRPQNSYEINTEISCDNKLIREIKNTNFLD